MKDMFSLAGKNAFITGGASGIGRAVAEAFVSQGAQVVIGDIQDSSPVAKEIGAQFVLVDVSDEDSVSNALRQSTKLCGGQLDTVVLNAGVGAVGVMIMSTVSNTDASS